MTADITIDIEAARGDFQLRAAFRAPGSGVTALFGPSGCGKTSLLMAVAGLLRPQRGRIAIGDTALFDAAAGVDQPPERRRIGVVFQDARLFPHLSVAANLRYGQRHARAAPIVGHADLLELLDLMPLLERLPGTLSGGEKQRVAIGRALLSAPRLLLLDEPMAALDAARRIDIRGLLARLRTTLDIPMLLVTHDFGDVLKLADHLVLMQGGTVTDSGPLAEVAQRLPAHRPIEAGVTAATLIEGRVVEIADLHLACVETALGRLTVEAVGLNPGHALRLSIPAREVILARASVPEISVVNQLPATIQALDPDPSGNVRVTLRVGNAQLLALVTAASAARMRLGPGEPVYALIKALAPVSVAGG